MFFPSVFFEALTVGVVAAVLFDIFWWLRR